MFAGVACGQPRGSTDAQPQPGADPQPSPQCRAVSDEDALASFDGEPCPWVLSDAGAGLRLETGSLDSGSPISGALPGECTDLPCVYRGAHTTVGPLILAVRPSPHSEMPEAMELGLVVGDRLSFVDLWAGAGPSVMGDSTPLGPAFTLAPFECEGGVGLLVEARLNAAAAIAPPPSLKARAGVYGRDDAGAQLVRTDVDASRCVRLPIEL